MKKNNKKGFTIVELVIVIAVIAILAAVLIPTFSSIIKKAKVNNDIGTIANLNKGLAIAQATDGTPKTMTEVLVAAEDNGYTVEKLTPTAEDYYYCWNQNENKFFLVNDEFKPYDDTISYNANNSYWMIIHDATELTKVQGASTKFCLYFAYNPTTAENPMFNATVGVDTGNYDFDLQYAGTIDNVTIRTNGGDLTVNSTTGTIYHYGEASLINIIECDDKSYHENGKVDEIKLAKGRVVVESNGEVGSVMVTATDVSNIKIENNGTLGGVAANNDTAAPELKNKVTGVDENKVLTEAVDNSEFAGGLGTESSPYLIGSVKQWVNLAAKCQDDSFYTITKDKHYKVITDLDFSNETDMVCIKYFAGFVDFCNHSILGFTEDNMKDTAGFFETVKGNVSFSNAAFYPANYVDSINSLCVLRFVFMTDFYDEGSVEMTNINVYGNINMADNNSGLFLNWAYGYVGSITFKDCRNYCSMVNSGYTAAFLGLTYGRGNSNIKLTFDGCENYGTLISTNQDACMLVSNPTRHVNSDYGTDQLELVITNCRNYGKIYAGPGYDANLAYNDNNSTSGFYNGNDIDKFETDNKIVNMTTKGAVCTNLDRKDIKVVDGKFDFATLVNSLSDAVRFEVSVQFQGTGGSGGGGITNYFFSFDSKESILSANMYAYEWKNATNKTGVLIPEEEIVAHTEWGTKYFTHTEDDTTYYVYNIPGCWMGTSKPVVNLLAYDEEGNVLLVGYYIYQ